MIGHLVADSVSWERAGKREDARLERERSVCVCVLPRNGHIFLKRERFTSLSMAVNETETIWIAVLEYKAAFGVKQETYSFFHAGILMKGW